MPKFGGLRGAKPRKDGLVPGSPEAVEADRKRDAARKRDERAALAAQIPPAPLPSALQGSQSPSQPSFVPLGSDAPGQSGPVVTPWNAEDLQSITSELIDAMEDAREERYVERCREAKLPETVAKEIGRDARLPAVSKKGLNLSAPRVAAKWLNKAGIDSEHKDELVLAGCLTAIFAQGRQLTKRLEKLISSEQSANAVEKL